MARHLALDWDYQQLRIVAGTVRAGELHIEQAALLEEEQSPNIAEAGPLGRRLREHLKAAGITPAPVLACVGRDRVILREVRYPSVAAAEVPAIVRFQVMKELTDAASEVVIDYTPLGDVAPGEERRALVLTVRRELLVAYQNLCQAAGLKLLALTPRPFGTLACLRESMRKREGTEAFAEAHKNGSPHAAVALLTAAENWSEFCLVHGDTLLLARSLPAGPTLAAEVRRNIATYTAQSPRHVVSALYLAGNGETADLQESLQQTLAIPVRAFDPFFSAEGTALPRQNRGAFAGPIGLLRAYGDGRRLPINFACPKEPVVARDPNKRRLAAVAGIAAVLVLGVAGYCYAQLAALDNRIGDLMFKDLTFENQKVQVDEDDKRNKEFSEWAQGNICWLDELDDLTARLPLNAIRLFEFEGKVKPRTKDKPGLLTLIAGTTEDSNPLDDLVNQMRAERGHYVSHAVETASATVKLAGFPRQYKTQIDVEKQPLGQFTLALPKAPPEIRPAAHSIRRPVLVHDTGDSPVDRKRVALAQHSDRVKLIATTPVNDKPNGAAGRGIPVKHAATPAAPVQSTLIEPAQNFEQSFEAILDAQKAGNSAEAMGIIKRARSFEKTRELNKVPQVSAPPAASTTTAPATTKGKKQ